MVDEFQVGKVVYIDLVLQHNHNTTQSKQASKQRKQTKSKQTSSSKRKQGRKDEGRERMRHESMEGWKQLRRRRSQAPQRGGKTVWPVWMHVNERVDPLLMRTFSRQLFNNLPLVHLFSCHTLASLRLSSFLLLLSDPSIHLPAHKQTDRSLLNLTALTGERKLSSPIHRFW